MLVYSFYSYLLRPSRYLASKLFSAKFFHPKTKVLDKIFQPFFTTKPAGQGSGLGLSLSYDIVKAHGGELKVQTTEGEGTAFIILLPL